MGPEVAEASLRKWEMELRYRGTGYLRRDKTLLRFITHRGHSFSLVKCSKDISNMDIMRT